MKPLTLEETAAVVKGWIECSKTEDQLRLCSDVVARFIISRFHIEANWPNAAADLERTIIGKLQLINPESDLITQLMPSLI